MMSFNFVPFVKTLNLDYFLTFRTQRGRNLAISRKLKHILKISTATIVCCSIITLLIHRLHITARNVPNKRNSQGRVYKTLYHTTVFWSLRPSRSVFRLSSNSRDTFHKLIFRPRLRLLDILNFRDIFSKRRSPLV